MEYIQEGATLPVPFNIIPTPKSFYYLIKNLIDLVMCRRKKAEETTEKPKDLNDDLPPIKPRGKAANNNLDAVENGLKPVKQVNIKITYFIFALY